MPHLKTAWALLGLLPAITLAGVGGAAESEFEISEAGHHPVSRSAGFASDGFRVPWLYFHETAAVAAACLGDSTIAGSYASLCVGLDSINSALQHAKGDTTAALSLARQTFSARLQGMFKTQGAFSRPAIFKQIRFLAYLDTLSLLDSPAYAVDNATRSRLLPILSRLKQASAKRRSWLNSSEARRSRAVLMQRLMPDLGERIAFADYFEEALRLDKSLWEKAVPDFLEFDLQQVLKLGQDEYGNPNNVVTGKYPFLHKLNILLRDALWEDARRAGASFELSSYLFGSTYILSSADSAFIQERVRRFGVQHQGLAYRVDKHDSSTWKNEKATQLENAIVEEQRAILRGISPRFQGTLDSLPDLNVKILIPGWGFPDYFGFLKYRRIRRDLVAGSYGAASDMNRNWIRSRLAFLGEMKTAALDSATSAKDFENRFQDLERNLPGELFNYYRLAYMDLLSYPFSGSIKELRDVVEEKRPL